MSIPVPTIICLDVPAFNLQQPGLLSHSAAPWVAAALEQALRASDSITAAQHFQHSAKLDCFKHGHASFGSGTDFIPPCAVPISSL
jgi:hypothetical protein